MKKYISLVCLCILCIQSLRGQVGIGTQTPNTSSALDISSITKGFLIPRMTTAQRNSISNPAKGLIVYNVSEDCIEVNTGTRTTTVWNCLGKSTEGVMEVSCITNGFEGDYYNNIPLGSSHKFTVTITNNSLRNSSFSFATSDLANNR